MSQGSRVLLSIRVNATPARAFAAFTEEIGQWWLPNGLFEFTRGRSFAEWWKLLLQNVRDLTA
jgi:hypothetical protein